MHAPTALATNDASTRNNIVGQVDGMVAGAFFRGGVTRSNKGFGGGRVIGREPDIAINRRRVERPTMGRA
jgi:hypothetical protein